MVTPCMPSFDSLLNPPQGRMAERIRTHEDRSKQAAMAAISSTREERDRAAEAAEVARSSEARARMLLEVNIWAGCA